MKKNLSLLIFCFYLTVFSCPPCSDSAYLNCEDSEYYPKINEEYELIRLGKYFYPDAFEQKFTKRIADRDKVTATEIMEICRNNREIDGEGAKKLIGILKEMHQNTLRKIKTEKFDYDEKHFKDFVLYEQGLYELAEKPDVIPPPSWAEILNTKQPASQDYRRAWVLYMLGNINFQKLYSGCYGELREAVKDGLRDSLGLAYDSFRADYIYSGDLSKALYCFCVYYNLGEREDAAIVLMNIKHIIRKAGRKSLLSTLKYSSYDKKSGVSRELILLFRKDAFGNEIPSEFEADKFICADRLAFQEYMKGDKKKCLEYLGLSPSDSMTKLWLLGRFARQEKRYKEAAQFLGRWLELYSNARETSLLMNGYLKESTMQQDVMGVMGSALAGEGKYEEALYTFMKADSYSDAACVAERLIDTAELMKFCMVHCGDPENDYMQFFIRSVLARRLMRENKFDDARKFFSGDMKEILNIYSALCREGNDFTAERDSRSKAFLKAGIILDRFGHKLFGTFLHPDKIDLDGCHFYTDLKKDWQRKYTFSYRVSKKWFPSEEKHYRYLASKMFYRAAEVADDINLKVLGLYLAGNALRYLNDARADIYYKMLCDCRPHPFAEEAFNIHWLPQKLPADLQELYNHLNKSLPLTDGNELYLNSYGRYDSKTELRRFLKKEELQ